VGIGTTNPNVQLQVEKDSGSGEAVVSVINATDGTGSSGRINLAGGSNGNACEMSIFKFAQSNTVSLFGLTLGDYSTIIDNCDNSHGKGLLLGTVGGTGGNGSPLIFGTNNTERMRILEGGNVGIGTTSPASPLHVIANYTSSSVLQVRNQSTTAGSSRGLFVAAGTNSSDYVLALRDAADNDLVRVVGNGNFGIGTTNPGAALHVMRDMGSTVTAVARFRNTNSTAKTTRIQLEDSAGAVGDGLIDYVHSDANTANHYLGLGLNSSTQLVLRNGGNIGIGTASPVYKLDVNGNTNVTGNIIASGSIAAKYQDVAEWVPSSEQLSPGTVVVLDSTKSNQVTSSTSSYDTRVAGVVSEQPGIALGEKSENNVLVATTGRVRVKVDATKSPIHIGDLLVTSDIPGVAMKSEPLNLGGAQIHRPGTLIGKALEPLEKGKGEILVLLSLQ
jgi:hypothetical protein